MLFIKKGKYRCNDFKVLLSTYATASLKYLHDNEKKSYDELKDGDFVQAVIQGKWLGSHIHDYKLQLESLDFQIDNDIHGLHFLNGRLDLLTGEFMPRQQPNINNAASIITVYLPYNYSNIETETAAIYQEFKRTVPDEAALNYILYMYGKALLGDVSGCDCLFALGSGSNGKSTMIKFIKEAFTSNYYKDLPQNALDSDANFQRAICDLPSTVRFLFMAEISKTKKSSSSIKMLCDGEISCKVLYQNGSSTVKINAKLFAMSNNIIRLESDDGGTRRRCKYCIYTVKFTDNPNEVIGTNILLASTYPYGAFTDERKCGIVNLIARYGRYNNMPQPYRILSGDVDIVNKDILEMFFISELDMFMKADLGTDQSSLNGQFVHMVKKWSIVTIPTDNDEIPNNAAVQEHLTKLLTDGKEILLKNLLEVYAMLFCVVTGKLSGPIARPEDVTSDFLCYEPQKIPCINLGKLNQMLSVLVHRKTYSCAEFICKTEDSKSECIQRYDFFQNPYYMDLTDLKTLRQINTKPKGENVKIDIKIFRDIDNISHINNKVGEKLKNGSKYVVILDVLLDENYLPNLYHDNDQVIIVKDSFRIWRSMVSCGLVV